LLIRLQANRSSTSLDIQTDPIILATLKDHFTRQEERDRQLAHDFATALEKNSHEVRSALQENSREVRSALQDNSREVRSALDEVRVALTEIKDTFSTYLLRQESREEELAMRWKEAAMRSEEAEKRQEMTQAAILEALRRSDNFSF
jgi:hypothetical protein